MARMWDSTDQLDFQDFIWLDMRPYSWEKVFFILSFLESVFLCTGMYSSAQHDGTVQRSVKIAVFLTFFQHSMLLYHQDVVWLGKYFVQNRRKWLELQFATTWVWRKIPNGIEVTSTNLILWILKKPSDQWKFHETTRIFTNWHGKTNYI